MAQTKETPTAKDFMHKDVVTVNPGTTLAEIVKQLLKHEVSNVPVVDSAERPRLVGFVSESDCMEHLSNEIFYGNPAPKLTAEVIMKRHPVCVGPDTEIFALASIFTSHRLRHLPVVDNQELLGIVSRRDILKALDRYYRDASKLKDDERHRPDIKEIVSHRFIVKS